MIEGRWCGAGAGVTKVTLGSTTTEAFSATLATKGTGRIRYECELGGEVEVGGDESGAGHTYSRQLEGLDSRAVVIKSVGVGWVAAWCSRIA